MNFRNLRYTSSTGCITHDNQAPDQHECGFNGIPAIDKAE